MGERKGVNKYYPPDFDPAKHGSLNGYWKTHPLRERARKLSQGILIIRFEMPYNIWCDGCKNHIGMGVRYNAEKKKVGNYYTTPIYRFRMKCHLCVNYIEMQTDPATCDYVIVSGAQRKEERWDMAENEQILTTEHSEKEKLETDAMYKLDHGGRDKEKLRASLPTLNELQEQQAAWKDDFQINSALRRKFRDEKKVIAEEEQKDDEVRKRTGLSIPLLPEKEEDKRLASLLTFQSPESYDDRQQSKRKEISTRSWFSSPTGQQVSPAGSLLHRLTLGARGAAGAPATKMCSAPSSVSQLGLIRKKGAGGKWPCAAVSARRTSSTEDMLSDTTEERVTAGLSEGGMEGAGWAEPQGKETNQESEMMVKCKEADVPPAGTSRTDGASASCGNHQGKDSGEGASSALRSLVADYSDSD
uniref:Probable splicing factor YJU2B n=1 Tax=Paramormyrops kingsleyae TaxID=1676925 RepID=A0A3B3RQQ2_9TELE|nr:coiled-coil domain-containing protein 130 [Paramormyrops kingsleyae]XP_023670173.1 coiled-coil domain-containing protein 130 [Paramormyrops kingsleyae]